MRTSRPPIDGDVLREARLRKGMTQEEVQRECANRGRPVYNISRMESGDLKWPSPRVLLILADVLGLEVKDFFKDAATPKDGDSDDADEDRVAA